MRDVVVCPIAAIRNKNDWLCKLRSIDQFHKRPGFVLFPSILYDGVQKKLTFQIIQRVQVQQVIAASVLCAVEVGSLVMDIARDLHMGAIHGQQCVPVPPLFGTVPECKTAQNVFKD